jgi:exopolysaccharide production protein ExoQ
MPPSLATFLVALGVYWLFRQDMKARKGVSSAIWIPFAWACVIGTKPISIWLGMGAADSIDGYQDSLIDKLLFFVLIIWGWIVLSKRRVHWGVVFRENKWLMIYFVYLAASVLWAEDPFVAFKRWFKDFGNIIMVLVLLTEEEPMEAIKALLARCAYLLIPLSVLVVKYYPESSRRYDQWDNKVIFLGISTDKNMFGMTLFVCLVSLFWLFLEARQAKEQGRLVFFKYVGLMTVTVWLLTKARSSTAMTCGLVCCAILLAMKVPFIRNSMRRMGGYIAVAAVVAVLLQAFGLWEVLLAEFAKMVGRDPTFHGRTNIWQALLKEDMNPLIGEGYYSFWSMTRMKKLSEKYYYLINEAHNGYLESYLNTGLIGLGLLLTMLMTAANSIKKQVVEGVTYGALRLAFLVASIFYGVSEAVFNRLSFLWLLLLLSAMTYPRRQTAQTAAQPFKETEPEQPQGGAAQMPA